MNLAEQNAHCEAFFKQCKELLLVKGTDYTPENIAFKDVSETAREIGVTTSQALWVYFKKHYTAIKHYILKGQTASESVDSRLMDLANYCALLYVLAQEEKRLAHYICICDSVKTRSQCPVHAVIRS